ncbi:MAG: UDP-N-acetylmuramate dehydrogenase, partial [Anaerolineales bacterium]|nr:UDP-N-acetylmuramate dehydrogenase [Anaerolineales bacterium]
AAGIPGTLGGAIYGNAGAHGSDMRANLRVAEILHPDGMISAANPQDLGLEYRFSSLKRNAQPAVILAATLDLAHSQPELVEAKMEEFRAFRRRTQPPGASMGSMFKNPPGNYAGRLIDAVGLKGARRGDAQISELHANFFVNLGQAQAGDVYDLIELARERVLAETGIKLELEIQLLGAW